MKKPVVRKKLPGTMVGAAQSEVQLGIGYNSFTGETRGFAVEDTNVRSEVLRGQEVLYSIREVENREQLRQHLGVSASASYSGIFSVSAKAEWSHDTTIDNHYFYLLISARVKNGATMLEKYELTKEAKNLLAKSPYNWKAFYARYGDMFVHSFVSGGEFHALYEFQTHSREDKDNLKTSAKGSYGGFTASAEFQKKLESIVTRTTVSADLFIRGGQGKLPDPIDPKKIIEASLSFPSAVHPDTGAPVQYDFDYREFLVADGFPSGEDVPFYSEVSDRNREVIARLARLNDRAGEAQKTASDPLYSKALQEEIARLRDQLKNKVHALAANPCTPHEFPDELETTFNGIRKQLIWRTMPGDLSRISVGSHTYVWGLNGEGRIFQWDEKNGNWMKQGGILQTISVGSDGVCMGVNAAGAVFLWIRDKKAWQANPISKKIQFDSIAVGNQKNIFWLNKDGIASSVPFPLIRGLMMPDLKNSFRGRFSEVSAGSDGTIWIRDPSDKVYHYHVRDKKAELIPGEMKHISVGDARHVWGINTDNQVVRWKDNRWIPVQGALTDISAAEDGTVWGITTRGTVVRLDEEFID